MVKAYRKKIDPVQGVSDLLSALRETIITGKVVERELNNVFRTEENGWIVDTCVAFDTRAWETGIYPPDSEDCQIVEQYPNEDEAKKGHDKWVALMRENPDRKLPDISIWDIDEDDEGE